MIRSWFLTVAVFAAISGGAWADDESRKKEPKDVSDIEVTAADPAVGRDLFVKKACVACHKVNGVGGPHPLNYVAGPKDPAVAAAVLLAEMWNEAQLMAPMQRMHFGKQTKVGVQEAAHMAAFLFNRAEQVKLTEDQIPEAIRKQMDHAEMHQRHHGGGMPGRRMGPGMPGGPMQRR
ncbi:MAG: c-type cytochrome [Alphaproteobacteria bacterium]|jgi:mono/diheme cytochrome c family protein|nr:c-type cytochrome [Alphaproteobacteria bacterium]